MYIMGLPVLKSTIPFRQAYSVASTCMVLNLAIISCRARISVIRFMTFSLVCEFSLLRPVTNNVSNYISNFYSFLSEFYIYCTYYDLIILHIFYIHMYMFSTHSSNNFTHAPIGNTFLHIMTNNVSFNLSI
jgi:hypothetical protein